MYVVKCRVHFGWKFVLSAAVKEFGKSGFNETATMSLVDAFC